MKPIVVGVDGSRASEAALRWAAETARELGRRVHALTIVPATGWVVTAELGGWLPVDSLTLEDEGRARLDRAISNAVPVEERWRLERKVMLGIPARSLIDASSSASMVVIGAKRRGAISRFVDGSLQPVLLRRAACPVVVVPEHHDVAAAVADQLDRELALVG